MSGTETLYRRIAEYVVLISTLLIIIGLLPFTDFFLTQSKYFLFIVTTLLISLIYAFYSIRKGTLAIVVSPILVPLVLFGIAMLASTFFTNSYFVEPLLGFGGIFLAGILYVLFAGTLVGKFTSQKLLATLAISGSVLSVAAIAQQLGFGPANVISQFTGLALPTNLSFSLAGSTFIALQLISLIVVGLVADTVVKKKVSKVAAITLPILVIGLVLHVWAILPGKPAELILPNWAASWSVALDTVRTPRAALIGAGTDSYANVYSRFKPVWMNNTESWSIRFNQASDTPLTLLTTTGFIGLVAWIFLSFAIIKQFKKVQSKNGKVFITMLIGTLLLQLAFPPNLLIWIVQVVLMVGYVAAERKHFSVLKFQAFAMSISRPSKQVPSGVETRTPSLPVYLTAGALLIGVVALAYLTGRAYAASVASYEAKKALNNNDVIRSYELQQLAVRYNPYYDLFRREYALTNMLIATAIANNAEELSPAEQEQASALLQQAVREAQAATVLDNLDVQSWAALAQIYQGMIGAVEGADQWAVQAYVNAINNDPTNPTLRVSLGGIFIGQENYQQAVSIFDQAVQIKPNFPNSYYNLAFALKQLGAYQQSAAAYQTLLTLLDPASEDYQTVTAEYEEVQAMAEEQAEVAEEAAPSNNSILDQNLNNAAQERLTPEVDEDVDLTQATPLSEELGPAEQQNEQDLEENEERLVNPEEDQSAEAQSP